MRPEEQQTVNREEEMRMNPPTDIDNETDTRPAERLSTRDLAAGTAVRQAREEINGAAPGLNGRESEATPLFESGEAETLRNSWTEIQTKFVDEPRHSVEEADQLVASAMKRLAEIFANERESLEKNWDRGDDVSTEDLRIALQRYRSFFDRLLSV